MKVSSELLSKAGLLPKLHLAVKSPKGVQGTGPHTVVLKGEKIVKGMDYEKGVAIEKLRYIVSENGEEKQYETRIKSKDTGELSYFVRRMAEIPEGSEVTLEFKRAGMRGYIEITVDGQTEKVDEDESGEESIGDDAVDSVFDALPPDHHEETTH